MGLVRNFIFGGMPVRLDKAIGILKSEQMHGVIFNTDDWNDAIKLGIEALRYVKTSRDPSGVPSYPLLPGETKK